MSVYTVNTTCDNGTYMVEASNGHKKYMRKKTQEATETSSTSSQYIIWTSGDSTTATPQQTTINPGQWTTTSTYTIPSETISVQELVEMKKKFDELENFVLQKMVDLIAEKEELEFKIKELQERIEDLENKNGV